MAVKDYTKTIELNPKHVRAYVNRGVAYGDIDEVNLAINDLNKAIELKSDDAIAYSNLGNVYGNEGDFDSAIANYNKAINLNSNEPVFYHNRGLAYFNNNDFVRAREDYTKVLKLDHDYAPAYYNRAMAWLREERWDKAKASLTDAADKGINIIAVFGKDYQSITNFEEQTGVKLPKDIAAMLKQQAEQTSTPSGKKKLFEFQSEMEFFSFESFAAMSAQPKERNKALSDLIGLPQVPSTTSPSQFAS